MSLPSDAFIDRAPPKPAMNVLRRSKGKFYLITSLEGTEVQQKYGSSHFFFTSVFYGVYGCHIRAVAPQEWA